MKTTTTKLSGSLLLSITLLIQCSWVNGQWSPDPTINNLICDLPSMDGVPKIATCSDGSIYVGFLANESGNFNVMLQKLSSDGYELWPHNGLLISDHPTDTWTSDWDLAVDDEDHAVLTFCDMRMGVDWQSFAYRISPSGTFAWGRDGIQLSYSGFNTSPKVICTSEGNSIFAWGCDTIVKMQKIDRDGIKQWGDIGIILSADSPLTHPQLLKTGADNFVIKYFYDQGDPSYPTRQLYVQKYTNDGIPVWPTPTVVCNTGDISPQTVTVSMEKDDNEGLYIAWHDLRNDTDIYSSFIQHIDASGMNIWTTNGIELSTQNNHHQQYPFIAVLSGVSDVFVFWNEMNGTQSQKGIYGQKLSSDGTRLWGTTGMLFIEPSSVHAIPQAVSTSDTDIIVMYSLGMNQYLGMRIAQDGSLLWEPSSVAISTSNSLKTHAVMSNFNIDQWIISWEDYRDGELNVYAQNIQLNGSLGPVVYFGSIQGHVNLSGGMGNVTQVVVSAGVNSTFPDPTGDYFLEVPTGTYTVTASLNGYSSDSVSGVTVLKDSTVTDVDLELIVLPATGWIEGTVELLNGNGDVTQTTISAGEAITNPDENGYYIMEVAVGNWDLLATLDGYIPQMYVNVGVEPGQTTSDMNFQLTVIPNTGFLYGNVSIEGRMADVQEAIVSIGSITISPDINGDYLIELPVGTHIVKAEHSYTSSNTASVIIEPGTSTGQDFYLPMLRRNLIVRSIDESGSPLIGSIVQITGPEGDYYDIMEADSLVFNDVPYGVYSGECIYGNNCSLTDTIIDATNNKMEFVYITTSTYSELFETLLVRPNPVHLNQSIDLMTDKIINGKLLVFDTYGRKCGEVKLSSENLHSLPVRSLFANSTAKEGLYLFKVIANKCTYSGKVLLQS